MKIALAGGGTGGHIAPGIALAEASAATNRGDEFLFLFPSFRLQPFRLPTACRWEEVPASAFSLRRIWRLPSVALANLRGYLVCRRLLKDFSPRLVVGLGGYASVPALLAAAALKIPVVIHEQNRRPGRANRLLSRFAAGAALGLPPEGDPFPGRSCRLTGIPVREAVRRSAPPELLSSWGWSGRRFTVLVMGGSSGAGFINRLFCWAAPLWRESGEELDFLHLAGRGEDEVAAAYRAAGLRAKVFRFFEEMGCLYSLADLLICRAGAVTLSEAAWWGLPMILIPYPLARDDHQHANALYFSSSGAAELWREKLFSPEALVEAVLALKNDAARRKAMAARARSLSHRRAAEDILDMIDELKK